jgi:predicted XRE-type DNA-binding protein
VRSKEQEEQKERQRERNREWKRRHPQQHAESVRNYRQRYPEKYRARRAVQYAVQTGKLVRLPCQKCATTVDVHAHHEDYAKPLEVSWLCRGCHTLEHLPDNVLNGKLTEAQARKIRALLATELISEYELAMLFGVTQAAISAIRRGLSWGHVNDGLIFRRGKGRPGLAPHIVQKIHDLAGQKCSQADIARALAISTASVSRTLHGRR